MELLTTSVAKSNVDDWKKLRRCISYLNQTVDNVRTIRVFNFTDLFAWVDVSYSVHTKMLSQTGGVISMGHRMLHCQPSKKNLNEKSLTGAELIGTSEYITFNVWMVMFLEAQVYDLKKNIIYQDVKSAISMANNGRVSCTVNYRHINIRHLFVKDRVDKGEIEVKYCTTNMMIAEYFTKPLQGKMFKIFRDLIMGYVYINDILQAIEL